MKTSRSAHPLYHLWREMHRRCSNPNADNYPRYGGRGVKVCERWNNFLSFLEDVEPRPSPEHTLDRYPDRHGDYEPINHRWATPKEQQLNRDMTCLVTVDGITDSVHATERRIGIAKGSLRDRIKRGYSAQLVVDKWRTASTSCRDNRKILFPRGHKLAWSNIPLIRLGAFVGESLSSMARCYNVERKAIRSVLTGRTWRESADELREMEEFLEAVTHL
jgi:hypothetical protein